MSLRAAPGRERYSKLDSKESDDEDFKGRSSRTNFTRDYDVVCLCTLFTVATILFYVILSVLMGYILYDLEYVYKPLAQNATAEIKDGSGHLYNIEHLMGDVKVLTGNAINNITAAISDIDEVKTNQREIAACIGCNITHP